MVYGKIVFGIAIPSLIIIFLASLGSLDIGVSADYSLKTELKSEDVYSNEMLINQINLGSVNIKNEFFLPSRYEFENNIVCLLDLENVKPILTAGTLSYQDALKDYTTTSYPTYSHSNYPFSSLEVNAGKEKQAKIILSPSYVFTYKSGETLLSEYYDYDKIVLARYEQKQNYYIENPCASIDKDSLSSSNSIKLNFA